VSVCVVSFLFIVVGSVLKLVFLVLNLSALLYICISTVMDTAQLRPHCKWQSLVYRNSGAQISFSVCHRKTLMLE
jgi:hypothetical protein